MAHHVDADGVLRVLLRGGTPVPAEPPAVHYAAWVAALAEAVRAAANVTLPVNATHVVDINLTDVHQHEGREGDGVRRADDAMRAAVEHAYFATHPQHGRFELLQVLGTSSNLTDEALFADERAAFRSYLGATLDQWSADRLWNRTAHVHHVYRHAPVPWPAKALAVYMHCDCGCDRTGSVADAYALRYLGMSWKAVNVWNQRLSYGHGQKCAQWRSLQWFCYSLGGADAAALDTCSRRVYDCVDDHAALVDDACGGDRHVE